MHNVPLPSNVYKSRQQAQILNMFSKIPVSEIHRETGDGQSKRLHVVSMIFLPDERLPVIMVIFCLFTNLLNKFLQLRFIAPRFLAGR